VNRLHYLDGSACLQQRDLISALMAWQQFAEPREDDEALQQDIGELYFRIAIGHINQPEEYRLPNGEEPFTEAAKRMNDNSKVHFYRALTALRHGNIAFAQQALLKAVKAPDYRFNQAARFWLGLTQLQSEEFESAARTLELLASEECDRALRDTASHALVIAYSRLGEREKAAKLALAGSHNGGHANG